MCLELNYTCTRYLHGRLSKLAHVIYIFFSFNIEKFNNDICNIFGENIIDSGYMSEPPRRKIGIPCKPHFHYFKKWGLSGYLLQGYVFLM